MARKESVNEKLEPNRLSLNFHETFVPERTYVEKLIAFLSVKPGATTQEITEQTGIPQGKSSGKVSSTLSYCRGFGLVETENGPNLTAFGKLILQKDKRLKSRFTQWMLHLKLCRKAKGAEIWHQVFAHSYNTLGNSWTEESLSSFLESIFGSKNRSLVGPLLRMYDEASSFKTAGVLNDSGDAVERNPAPVLSDYMYGYASLLLEAWDQFFSGRPQVGLSEFEETTNFFASAGWTSKRVNEVLDRLGDLGVLNVNRYLGDPVMLRLKDLQQVEEVMYSTVDE